MKDNKIRCNYCQSENVSLHNKPNRYLCKDCGRTFRVPMLTSNSTSIISEGLTRLEVKLKTNEDRIRLIPLGDIHVGAPRDQCDWAKARRELDYILRTSNTYMLGMGDYMDCAKKMLPQHGPNIFQSSLAPMEQYNLIEEALKPLAKAGKIIGLHGGNHEQWITEFTGIQIIDLLCRSLKVPFLGPGCDITFKVNEQKYLCYSQHGSSNARMKHTKLGAVIDSTRDIFSELLLCGHVHQLGVVKGAKRLGSRQMKCYYLATGHFLNWEGSYAQMFSLQPSPSGCAQVKLLSDRHDIHVTI